MDSTKLVLKLKDGKTMEFEFCPSGDKPDEKMMANVIRNLQDDKYNITEDIKQEGLKFIMELGQKYGF